MEFYIEFDTQEFWLEIDKNLPKSQTQEINDIKKNLLDGYFEIYEEYISPKVDILIFKEGLKLDTNKKTNIVCDLLKGNVVNSVYMFGYKYNPQLFNKVIKTISVSDSVKSVNISSNNLNYKILDIAKILVTSNSLENLYLSMNEIGKFSVELATIISQSQSIKNLDLSSNEINKEMILVANKLVKSKSLSAIDLSHNIKKGGFKGLLQNELVNDNIDLFNIIDDTFSLDTEKNSYLDISILDDFVKLVGKL